VGVFAVTYTTNALMAFVNKALVLDASAKVCSNCSELHNTELCTNLI
jgi:hypothetical protein